MVNYYWFWNPAVGTTKRHFVFKWTVSPFFCSGSKWNKKQMVSCWIFTFYALVFELLPYLSSVCKCRMWSPFGWWVVKEETGMQAVLWALKRLKMGLNLLRHKWSSTDFSEWETKCILECKVKPTVWGDLYVWLSEWLFECGSVVFLTNVQILPCSTDILYLYSCILVYKHVLWLLLSLFKTN